MNERTEVARLFGNLPLSGGSRRAAVLRAAVVSAVAPLGLLLAVAATGAGNPAGFVLAIAPLHLLWVCVVDVIALFRGLRSPVRFATRPRFVLWVTACALPVVAYVIWATFNLQLR